MKLEEIVPEYSSKNPLIRHLFLKRLGIAFQLAQSELAKNNFKVVDLGCGDGSMLKIIEEKFKNVKTFGIDREPNIVKLKDFLKAEIKVADIQNSGFADNFFDLIFCLDVLEHFKDLEQPIKEIKRIIKPSGVLIISLPTESPFYKVGRFLTKGTMSMKKGPSCSFNFSPHFHNAKKIKKSLISTGFEPVKERNLWRILPLFYIASFKNIN